MEIRTIHDALRWATSFLVERDLEPPVAEWLLRHYLTMDRTQLLMKLDEPILPELIARLKQDLDQHASGTPVQHLIGYEEFYGRTFAVNKDVLIPRPETEELVVAVCTIKRQLFGSQRVTLVDVGTGSGAIAVTLALEEEVDVLASDISVRALKVATENATNLGAKVKFLQGDLLHPLIEQSLTVEIVVSNPPYIPLKHADQLAIHVVDHEPHLALFGGEDGLVIYRRLMKQLPFVLKRKAIVVFEVGIGQAQIVRSWLAHSFPMAKTDVVIDINKKERFVLAYGDMTPQEIVEKSYV